MSFRNWFNFFLPKSGSLRSADTSSKSRSSIPSYNDHPIRSIDPRTRYDSSHTSDYLVSNIGAINGAVEDMSKGIVGSGIFPTPNTPDVRFNQAANQWFKKWSLDPELCDVAGRRDFQGQQEDAWKGLSVAGDIFYLKSKNKKLQTIESHQVGYIPSRRNDKEGFIDGVKIDKLNRILAYSINVFNDSLEVISEDSYKIVKSSDIIHVMKFKKPHQIRGLPLLHGSGYHPRDIDDIISLAKQKLKVEASFGAVVESQLGGAGQAITEDFRNLRKNNSNDPAADGDGRDPNLDRFYGSNVFYTQPGEQIRTVSSDNPNPNLIPFLNFLMRHVSSSLGMPLEYIWDISSLGGVNTRYVLAKAEQTFNWYRNLLIKQFCKPVYKWVIGEAILSGELDPPTEGDYWDAVWQSPKRDNVVDYLRDTQADIQKLNNGLMTEEEYWGSKGIDSDEAREKIFSELKKTFDLSINNDIPLGMYRENFSKITEILNKDNSDPVNEVS